MIQTKILTFHHNGIDFEASIRYSDAPFGDRLHSKEPIFFNVQLLKPLSLNCGGESVKIGGMSAMMLLSTSVRNRHYIYDDKPKSKENDEEINIYPRAVTKILYHYFNRERIDYYHEKISRFYTAIDVKYEAGLEALRAERRVIRRKMRKGRINSKTYQKLYRPIRLKKDDLEYKILDLKSRYRERYFDCCELKKSYRVDVPDMIERCDTPLGHCEAGSDEQITTNKKGA